MNSSGADTFHGASWISRTTGTPGEHQDALLTGGKDPAKLQPWTWGEQKSDCSGN